MIRILFFFCIIFATSCGGLRDVTKFKKEDIVFSLKKGPCYGKCSVYNLDVYKNGYVVYEGIMNVEKYGLYTKKIKKEELSSLKRTFDQDGFYTFEDNYPVKMADLPTITMSYNKEKLTKTITGSLDRPQKLLALQRVLENLAKSEGFQLVKEYEVKTTQENEVEVKQKPVEDIIDNEIIIELNPNVFMAEWLRRYSNYDVQLMKRVAPDLNYWVITYNKQMVTPEAIMQQIKDDKQVKSAEFNKRVSNRTR